MTVLPYPQALALRETAFNSAPANISTNSSAASTNTIWNEYSIIILVAALVGVIIAALTLLVKILRHPLYQRKISGQMASESSTRPVSGSGELIPGTSPAASTASISGMELSTQPTSVEIPDTAVCKLATGRSGLELDG
ncbi:uncharacterized protein H6S33_003761 [Morchella sextelata]|uniref:uncharacterized protein n=1 Tax=Morchella sextelata TaxID=1174677 RepID=UPI001D048192|nr:uncharacterized protein H6S33_003761 [Morchella sextelata]KAH0606100.1 hypothetical protein H6S33_003761 [Morchella sextelata]